LVPEKFKYKRVSKFVPEEFKYKRLSKLVKEEFKLKCQCRFNAAFP
jgi:hypothetical protein